MHGPSLLALLPLSPPRPPPFLPSPASLHLVSLVFFRLSWRCVPERARVRRAATIAGSEPAPPPVFALPILPVPLLPFPLLRCSRLSNIMHALMPLGVPVYPQWRRQYCRVGSAPHLRRVAGAGEIFSDQCPHAPSRPVPFSLPASLPPSHRDVCRHTVPLVWTSLPIAGRPEFGALLEQRQRI